MLHTCSQRMVTPQWSHGDTAEEDSVLVRAADQTLQCRYRSSWRFCAQSGRGGEAGAKGLVMGGAVTVQTCLGRDFFLLPKHIIKDTQGERVAGGLRAFKLSIYVP